MAKTDYRATRWLWTAILGLTVLMLAVIEPPPRERYRLEGGMSRAELDAILRAREVELGRPLGREQQDELIESLLNQELLFAEGVHQGLLEGDPVVKRRVVELVLEQVDAKVGKPTASELQTFYRSNRSRYRLPAQWRFRQFYFPATDYTDAAAVKREAERIKSAGDELASIHEGWPHRLRVHDDGLFYHRQTLENIYGPSFTDKLIASDPDNRWVGPLKSGLGWHLLHIDGYRKGTLQPLADVRSVVRRDWRQAKRQEATREMIEQLRRQGNPMDYFSH